MRIAFFGTYDEQAHPRVRVLREGLAAAGADVVEVDVPLGLDTSARVRIAAQPWRAPVLVARIAAAWLLLLVRWRRARRGGPPDAVVVGYLGHVDVLLARRLFRGTIALDHMVSLADTADDRGVGSGRVQRLLSAVDRRAVRTADVVVVDTEEHAGAALALGAAEALVVPVGAPEAWYRAGAAAPPPGGPLRVVFFGLYTPLQGAPVIGRALARLRDEGLAGALQVTMIGSGQDRAETQRAAEAAGAAPWVEWVEWVPGDELPAVVAAHDVCLGIFGTGAKAQRVVPNKVYQGLAAGCAVVTSDTPPQRRMLGDAVSFVPPGSDEALAAALRGLVTDPAAARARRAPPAMWRPEAVVAPLAARLGVT